MEKINSKLNLCLKKINDLNLKIPSVLLLLICLTSLYLTTKLNTNEETYFQLAKQFINPNWIYKSQNLTDFAGSKILYNIIIGTVLQYLSFESTLFIFRTILIFSYSIVLNKIYKFLNLNNSQIILHLVLFILIFEQSFFAGSWIFLSVEPKGFAYIFVFLAFYNVLIENNRKAFIYIVVATYFHILVGGYTFLYFIVTKIFFKINNKIRPRKLILLVLGFFILILPLLIYATPSTIISNNLNNSISPSWIHCYYRNPHHTALFKTLSYFINEHLFGVIYCIFSFMLAILLYPLNKMDSRVNFINQYIIITFFFTIIFVPLGYLDKNGDVLKFYLYRINTFSTFLFSISLSYNYQTFINKKYINNFTIIILLGSFLMFLKPIKNNILSNVYQSKIEENKNNLASFIKKNTSRKCLIFTYVENDLDMIRKSERNMFSIFKFFPTEFSRVQEWYKKSLLQKAALQDNKVLEKIVREYRIDYVITPIDKDLNSNFKIIYQNKLYRFYRTTN